jgi:hypothetical protein
MWAAPLTFLVAALSVPMTTLWHSFAGFLLRNVAPHI